MTIDEVVPLIEGNPVIGKVPVEPGLTNAPQRVEDAVAVTGPEEITGCDGATKEAIGSAVRNNEKGRQIVGLNTENAELNCLFHLGLYEPGGEQFRTYSFKQ